MHALRQRLGVRGLGLLLIWVTWSLIGLGVYQDESVTAAGASAPRREHLARGLRVAELPPPEAYYPSLNVRIPVWHAPPDTPRR